MPDDSKNRNELTNAVNSDSSNNTDESTPVIASKKKLVLNLGNTQEVNVLRKPLQAATMKEIDDLAKQDEKESISKNIQGQNISNISTEKKNNPIVSNEVVKPINFEETPNVPQASINLAKSVVEPVEIEPQQTPIKPIENVNNIAPTENAKPTLEYRFVGENHVPLGGNSVAVEQKPPNLTTPLGEQQKIPEQQNENVDSIYQGPKNSAERIVSAKASLNKEQTNVLKNMVAKNKKVLILSFSLMCLLAIICISFIVLSSNNSTPKITKNEMTEGYENILTQEEQNEWDNKKIAANEVTIQLNQKIEVNKNTSEAHIRLINPPYSNFISQVDIVLLDDGRGGAIEETIYSSEKLSPGTIVDYAKLSTNFSTGTYKANAVFNFYNSLGTLVGTYGTSVELEVS